MRGLRRHRNRKQVKIVLGTAICLLMIMTVGYAAFSTNITINAEINVAIAAPLTPRFRV